VISPSKTNQDAGASPFFPPLDQALIQAMACEIVAETEEPLSRQSLADLVRRAQATLGKKISRSTVWRMLHESAIKPWQHEHWLFPKDPQFAEKAGPILDLYAGRWEGKSLGRTDYVLSMDEKTSIQALDRLDPVLPLAPGRAERHGFEYYRHGTLSLYAALNTKTGAVIGSTAARHTSQEFVAFLADVVASQSRGREIHIIADNFSAHKTKLVQQFLDSHPKVTLHYTPTYSSWLNQVELWFAKVERDVIARGVFTSVTDLKRKLMKYIRRYNEHSRPIKWKYTDFSNRIGASNSTVTVH